jgi:hypothetical protein
MPSIARRIFARAESPESHVRLAERVSTDQCRLYFAYEGDPKGWERAQDWGSYEPRVVLFFNDRSALCLDDCGIVDVLDDETPRADAVVTWPEVRDRPRTTECLIDGTDTPWPVCLLDPDALSR